MSGSQSQGSTRYQAAMEEAFAASSLSPAALSPALKPDHGNPYGRPFAYQQGPSPPKTATTSFSHSSARESVESAESRDGPPPPGLPGSGLDLFGNRKPLSFTQANALADSMAKSNGDSVALLNRSSDSGQYHSAAESQHSSSTTTKRLSANSSEIPV